MSGLRAFLNTPKNDREWIKWIKEALIDGSVGTAELEDNSVTVAKLAQLTANSILANPTNALADVAALAAASNDTLLRRTSNALSFGVLTAGMFPALVVPDAALSANVALNATGSYTGTLTGCTTSPTASIGYVKVGSVVTLSIPTLTATSNTTDCTITGPAPSSIRPTNSQLCLCRISDNSVIATGTLIMDSGGTITLTPFVNTATAFTNANTKGTNQTCVTYALL